MMKGTKKEFTEVFLSFVIILVIFGGLGLLFGFYDHDTREDGWTEIIYHRPSGDSRY